MTRAVLFDAPGPPGPAGPRGLPGQPGPTGPTGPPGSGSAVASTGTGFLHMTASVLDPAARAVSLASSDVTGFLPVASIAAGTAGEILVTNASGTASWFGSASLAGNDFYLGGSTGAAAMILDWTTATTPFIQSGTSATSLTVGTNNSAAVLNFQAGAAATVLSLQVPANYGGVDIFFSGTEVVRVGTYADTTTQGAIWFGSAAVTPNTTNWSFLGDGANSYLNAPASGVFYFSVGGNTNAVLGATDFYFGGSNTAAPVIVAWPTSTTPTITSGTSATSLTVGTNKSAAVLNLQADAATTYAQLAAGGIQLLSGTPSLGGGTLVLGINNCTVAPTTNPSGGGILYVQAGVLKYRGSSGTITTLGPA